MNLYNYDNFTKEYLETTTAEADVEETRKQGEFIPLIPANATLEEVPYYDVTKDVAVFLNDEWVIKTDYRKLYVVDENWNVQAITTIDKPDTGYIVNETTADEIKEDSDWFKIVDNEVVKRTQAEYEQFKAQKERQRLDNLTRTRAEVWRALIQARMFTKSQVKEIIEALPEETEEQKIAKEIARIDVDDVEDFHRNHDLVNLVAEYLEITSENLDLYFDTGDYHYLEAEV